MQDVTDPEVERRVQDFCDRTFDQTQNLGAFKRTLFGRVSIDTRRPNLHDTKADLSEEYDFVRRSADDLFDLYRGLVARGEPSISDARGLHMDF